jgi:hypothetical protein
MKHLSEMKVSMCYKMSQEGLYIKQSAILNARVTYLTLKSNFYRVHIISLLHATVDTVDY